MSTPWKCDRKLWRTAKGKIVEDGDPRAAFLMATPGMELPEKPVIESFAGERPPTPESKAVKPDEDKAVSPEEDKSATPSDPSREESSGAQNPRKKGRR